MILRPFLAIWWSNFLLLPEILRTYSKIVDNDVITEWNKLGDLITLPQLSSLIYMTWFIWLFNFLKVHDCRLCIYEFFFRGYFLVYLSLKVFLATGQCIFFILLCTKITVICGIIYFWLCSVFNFLFLIYIY